MIDCLIQWSNALNKIECSLRSKLQAAVIFFGRWEKIHARVATQAK